MIIWIIKLGGSVITEKQEGVPVIREHTVEKLCDVLAAFIHNHPDVRLIVLHGAGSIGHPLAKRYGLSEKRLNPDRLFGMAKTVLSMRDLTNRLAMQLLDSNVTAIPLQTSSMFSRDKSGQLLLHSKEILAHILNAGGTPVFGGDIVLTNNKRTSIASADELAVELATQFAADRILFATNVDGIYESFPPRANDTPIKYMTREDIERITTQTHMPRNADDVTRGMEGKLLSLIKLRSVSINIFNGIDTQNLRNALAKNPVGTTIEL